MLSQECAQRIEDFPLIHFVERNLYTDETVYIKNADLTLKMKSDFYSYYSAVRDSGIIMCTVLRLCFAVQR